MEEWKDVDLGELGAVLWGSNPVHPQAKQDYFDSLYHSAAVIGLNTSAFIEAGIVGRPVFTLIVPRFEENQTATVHFEYLLTVGGGLLTVAHSFEEHARQLTDTLTNPPAGPRPFVREFVRPHGLDRPATPIFVEQVEAMQSLVVERRAADPLLGLLRGAARVITKAHGVKRLEQWTMSARERQSAEKIRALQATKIARNAAVLAAHAQEREEREQRRAAKAERVRQEQAAKEADKARRLAERDAHRAAKRRAKDDARQAAQG
jgi:hypothetical protein